MLYKRKLFGKAKRDQVISFSVAVCFYFIISLDYDARNSEAMPPSCIYIFGRPRKYMDQRVNLSVVNVN